MLKTFMNSINLWAIAGLLILSGFLGLQLYYEAETANSYQLEVNRLKSANEALTLDVAGLSSSLELEKFTAQQLRNERVSISAIHIQHDKDIAALNTRLEQALLANEKLRDHKNEDIKSWANCTVPAAVISMYKYATPGKNSNANAKCLPVTP